MNTPLTASVVARFLGIEVAGNNIFIECVSDVMEPLEKSILFIDKEQDQKIYDEINSIKSLAVITNIDISKRLNCTVIISNNPKYDYSKIISKFFWVNYDHEMLIGENENAVVSELDGIDPSVKIGSNTIISSDVTINKNTTIGHNSIIKGPCEIGEGVEIGSNTIIGADGFGYAFRHKLGYKIRHIGGVRIGDHVDIGDQCHIAKGTIRDTIIGNHVKINAQVRIAHNVNIGNRVIVAGGIISGSVIIGDDSWIAPAVVIRNKVVLGKNVLVGVGSVVTKSFADNVVIYGKPAVQKKKR